MAVALAGEAYKFLEAQHPHVQLISAAEYEAMREAILQAFKEGMNSDPARYGMFELLTQPDSKLREQSAAMQEFLNENLDPEIQQILSSLTQEIRQIGDSFGFGL